MSFSRFLNRRSVSASALALAFSLPLAAQDAALVLSTSVGYNTQRLSLKLTPEQATEAARLGTEATKANAAGKYGEALNDMAQGLAVMRGVAWTPEAEFASSLRGKLDHTMISPGKVTVSLPPLYPTPHASAAKLTAAVMLNVFGKDPVTLAAATPVDPTKPFVAPVNIPDSVSGNATIEVRLTAVEGQTPALPAAFTKMLTVHVESLEAEVKKLRGSLTALAQSSNPALPTAAYAMNLYELADQGEVNVRAYDFKKEFTNAQLVADTILAAKDPFAGKHGDFHRAYRSYVDKTLQPYRLFVPDGYDGSKPTPLVVALHGMGGDENSMFDSYGKELPKDAAKYGFIVVAPKGRGPAAMYRGDAEQDVLDVMAEVERDYKVDKSRIYLMGHSMGGYGTWSTAIDHPELFAALGPISGGGNPAGMAKIKHIPQYVTHGDTDPTVNVNMSRTMVEAGKKLGAPITYVEVPGGSHSSVAQPAFAPMMEFFSKQVKGKSVASE